MEEVDRVGDGVLDHHPPGVAVDELARRGLRLVGEQQGRPLVAQSAHGKLADHAGGPQPPADSHQLRRLGIEARKQDGAGEGTRTPDLVITNDALYRLSYTGHDYRQ